MFDRIGVRSGGRAIDIGCGPQGVLDLLSERVGSTGLVVGIERDDESVAAARQFVADRALGNVKVLRAEAASKGMPGDIFDLVHARLVLVNIPNAEAVVGEMVRLARPGGMVASHEADNLRTSAILPFEPGIVFARSTETTRPPTASTSLLAAARIACSVKQG